MIDEGAQPHGGDPVGSCRREGDDDVTPVSATVGGQRERRGKAVLVEALVLELDPWGGRGPHPVHHRVRHQLSRAGSYPDPPLRRQLAELASRRLGGTSCQRGHPPTVTGARADLVTMATDIGSAGGELAEHLGGTPMISGVRPCSPDQRTPSVVPRLARSWAS